MKRYSVERCEGSSALYIRDHGWVGSDCPKKEYPKPAIELRFASIERARKVCQLMNEEWQEFERNPN